MSVLIFKNKIDADGDLMFALSKSARILTNHDGIESCQYGPICVTFQFL